jgi:hypothetical protein
MHVAKKMADRGSVIRDQRSKVLLRKSARLPRSVRGNHTIPQFEIDRRAVTKRTQDHLRAWGVPSLLPYSGLLSRATGCRGRGAAPPDLMRST